MSSSYVVSSSYSVSSSYAISSSYSNVSNSASYALSSSYAISSLNSISSSYSTTSSIASSSAYVVATFLTSSVIGQTPLTTLYTTPAQDGMYEIQWILTTTVSSSATSTLGPFGFRYTHAVDNTVKIWPSANVNNINSTTTNNVNSGILSGVNFIYSKASSNIRISAGYTTSGATSMQYSLYVALRRMP